MSVVLSWRSGAVMGLVTSSLHLAEEETSALTQSRSGGGTAFSPLREGGGAGWQATTPSLPRLSAFPSGSVRVSAACARGSTKLGSCRRPVLGRSRPAQPSHQRPPQATKWPPVPEVTPICRSARPPPIRRRSRRARALIGGSGRRSVGKGGEKAREKAALGGGRQNGGRGAGGGGEGEVAALRGPAPARGMLQPEGGERRAEGGSLGRMRGEGAGCEAVPQPLGLPRGAAACVCLLPENARRRRRGAA